MHAYLTDQIGKADNTVACEEIHVRHLKRILGESTETNTITLAVIQGYVNARTKTKHRGKLLSGKTIRKELATFRQVWGWARKRQYLATECPIYDEGRRWAVVLPKPKEREKFQTWAQIKRRIARGGLTRQQKKELWDSLFLDEIANYRTPEVRQGTCPLPFHLPDVCVRRVHGGKAGRDPSFAR